MNNEHQNFGRNASSNLSPSSTTATSATSSSKFSSTTTTTNSKQQQSSPFNYIGGGSVSSSLSSSSSSSSACAGSINAIVAAIIPDTPIVSIAGATQLSDITTTTTSTTTTPTPTATPTTYGPASTASIGGPSKNTNTNNNNKTTANSRNNRNKKIPTDSKANPMSDASAVDEVAAQATVTSNSNDINDNTTTATPEAQTNDDTHTTTTTTTQELEITQNEDSKDSATTTTTNTTPANTTEGAATAKEETHASISNNNHSATNSPGATAVPASACNEVKSKEFAKPSAPKEISDMHDDDLKNLLEEAYSYKNPCDKENKSEAFLNLLKQAENADDYISPFPPITSRYTRNSTSSSTSSSGGHSGHHGHHHHHHNHHKQGGSLQNLDNVVDHNDSDFGRHQTSSSSSGGSAAGPGGRQKKFSSVSSRQREGGSLPSNVNASSFLVDPTVFGMFEGRANGAAVLTAPNKQQRRNAKAKSDSEKESSGSAPSATATSTATTTVDPFVGSPIPVLTTTSATPVNTAYTEDTDTNLIISLAMANGPNEVNGSAEVAAEMLDEPTATQAAAQSASANAGDCVIEVGEPLIEIQQKQQILHAKPHGIVQGLPYYDRTESHTTRATRNIAKAIPFKSDFAPTMSQSYVDETVAFENGAFALNNNGSCAVRASTSGGGASPVARAVELAEGGGAAPEPVPGSAARAVLNAEASYLPLDENYKSCKSVLGEKGDFTPNTALSSVFATTKTRQFDENGNSLSEMSAGLSIPKSTNLYNIASSCIGSQLSESIGSSLSHVPTTSNSTPLVTIGPTQMKSKSKKKSQQERNTKTVDVASVAGYRGNDTVEELLKYIENSDSDKQPGAALGSSKFDKKKERKNKHDKQQQQQQKMKKSNSLEELRSCSKIIVDDDLKRKAATTESNGTATGKGGKKHNNTSSSAADINKNFDTKDSSAAKTHPPNNAANNNRKGERRSWGTEELQYLGDQSTAATDEKVSSAAGNKKSKHKDLKDLKDSKESEKENHLSNSLLTLSRDHRFGDKQSNVLVIGDNDKVTATGIIAVPLLATTNTTSAVSAASDKPDKADKRKKADATGPAVILSPPSKGLTGIAVDLNALGHNESPAGGKEAERLTETAEFHVVTKKKKAKKQKSAFTGVATQSTSGMLPGGGGDDARSLTATSSATSNSKMNNVTLIGQQRYNKYNNEQQQRGEYHPPHRPHYQQAHAANPHNASHHPATDKSRRKSTSSMPPSEKSESSDLDSVHSLPIEKTSRTTTKKQSKQKQKHEKASAKKNQPLPAPPAAAAPTKTTTPAAISYADIARINREKAAAAAMALEKSSPKESSPPPPSVGTTPEMPTTPLTQAPVVVAAAPVADQPLAAPVVPPSAEVDNNHTAMVGSPIPVIVNHITTYPTLATKAPKGKRSASKPDFPELVASNSVAASEAVVDKSKGPNGVISYSQSLVNPVIVAVAKTTPATTTTPAPAPVENNTTVETAPTVPISTEVVPPYKEHKAEKRKEGVALLKTPEVSVSSTATTPPVVVAKKNEVEISPPAAKPVAVTTEAVAPTPVYTFMDQQYPALGRNVKRSGASASSTASAPPAAVIGATAPQFNFAAAAKQQINVHSEVAVATTTTTTQALPQAAPVAATSQPTATTATTSSVSKKAKEKSPTLAGALSFSEAVATSPPAVIMKKQKKDNKQQQPPVVEQPVVAPAVETPAVEPLTRSWSQMTQDEDDEEEEIIAEAPQEEAEDSTEKPSAATQTTSALTPAPTPTEPPAQEVSADTLGAPPATAMGPPAKPIRTTVSAATSTTSLVAAAAALANRPAVIIMNDDRLSSAGGGHGDTEFTFGDFNEGEITFFDDDDEKAAEDDDEVEPDMPDDEEQLRTVISVAKNQSAAFNDSGVAADPPAAMQQQAVVSSDDMIMVVPAADASSPNSSYGHAQIGGIGNQSGDSGIYTIVAKQPQQIGPEASPPPPQEEEEHQPVVVAGRGHPVQQFETCNQIESAILAAACQAAEPGGPHPMAVVPAAPMPQPQPYCGGVVVPPPAGNSYTVTPSSYTTVATNPGAIPLAYPATIQSPPPPPGTLVVAPHVLPVHRPSGHHPAHPQGQYIAYHAPPYTYNPVPAEYYAAGAPIIVGNEDMAQPPPQPPPIVPQYGRSRSNSRNNNNNYYYYNHHQAHVHPHQSHHNHHHHQSHHQQQPPPHHYHQQATPYYVAQLTEEPYEVMDSRTPTPPAGQPGIELTPAPALLPAPAPTEGVLVGHNKEFRVDFRHPHNQGPENSPQSQDYVVDFIGSSWEKIANNKNTRVYDDDL